MLVVFRLGGLFGIVVWLFVACMWPVRCGLRVAASAEGVAVFSSVCFKPVYCFFSCLEEVFCEFSFGEISHSFDLCAGGAV